jgi:hypothetical protein
VIQTTLTIAVLAWLPGAVIFRLPIGDRDRRAALDWEERLFWSIVISAVISTAVVLGLSVIDRYSFERLLIADLVIAIVAAAVARFKLGLGANASRRRLTAILPLVLVLLGWWRFFPSSEYVIGGRDPGAYINEGIQIAQRGTISYKDPVVASVPVFARDLFFPSHNVAEYYGLRFMGFFIRNPDSGAVIGQFPHLFPASIAIGYGVDGLSGAREAVGVWAMLGVLAVYFVGARLVGRTAAFSAGVLLTLQVVQVWFARYPNAEVVMQALLFAALLASARAFIDGDDFFAPIAGGLLGFLLFLRFDSVLAIGAVVGGLAVAILAGVVQKRGRAIALFLAALVAVTVAAGAYLTGPLQAYVSLPIVFLSNLDRWQYLVLTAAGCAAVAAFVVGARMTAVSGIVRACVPGVLTIALIAGAVYALYFRAPIHGILAERDAYALRTFTNFYLTLPGLLGALLGYALLARRAFWRAPELFVTVAVFAFFFFYKIRIPSEHFWMTRRFLPVVLPGALLFAAAAALSGLAGVGWKPRRALHLALGVVFVGLLGQHYARAAAPVLPHVEYAGIIPKLETISRVIGDRDLLIVESRGASDVHVLAVPLAYIYVRNVLVLDSPRPNREVFAAFLEWARTRYDRVLFMGGGGTSLLSRAWGVVPLASERFTIPEYDAPFDAYPRFIRNKEFDYSLYEITPPDATASRAPFDLDIGVNDDLYVVRFHAKERSEGRTFRWTRARSFVTLTSVQPSTRELVLWMNDGGRPPAAPAADVTVTLDNEPLGTIHVGSGFKAYALPISPELAGRVSAAGMADLSLSTPVWQPRLILGTPDDRDLGVMLDRVELK